MQPSYHHSNVESSAGLSIETLYEMGYERDVVAAALVASNGDAWSAFNLLQGEQAGSNSVPMQVDWLYDPRDVKQIVYVEGSTPGEPSEYHIALHTPQSRMIQNNCCLRCLSVTPYLSREGCGQLFKYIIFLMIAIFGGIALIFYLERFY